MNTNTQAQKSPSEQKRDNALREAGKTRTEIAKTKAEKGIRHLIKTGGAINFSTVAKISGVSTKFLHQNEELAERIRYIAEQQNGKKPKTTTDPQQAAKESTITTVLKRELVEEKQKNAELRERIKELELEKQNLLGRLAEYVNFME